MRSSGWARRWGDRIATTELAEIATDKGRGLAIEFWGALPARSGDVLTKDIFIVQPQPEGRNGFVLTGPTLPYPMWYLYEDHALAYARSSATTRGGEVRVLDHQGKLVYSEEIAPRRKDVA